MKKIIFILFALCTINMTVSAQVKYLTDKEFFEKIYNEDNNSFINSRGVVIDFYTTWCGYCKILKPRFNKVAKEYSQVYEFYRVDGDEEKALKKLFNIKAFPTIIYIPPKCASGQYFQSIGAIGKKTLINNIKKYLDKD